MEQRRLPSPRSVCAKLQHALPDLPFFNILYALRLTSAVRCGGPGAEHQRNRATPRNSAHDLRRCRRSIPAGHCATVDRAAGIRRPPGAPAFREGDYRTRYDSKRSASCPSTSRGAAGAGSPAAPGGSGIPLRSSAMHQVICDGWSLGVLAEELIASYDAFSGGQESPLGRSRSSSRTLRTGSGSGHHTRRSLLSLNTGESSFAIRCPSCSLREFAPRTDYR